MERVPHVIFVKREQESSSSSSSSSSNSSSGSSSGALVDSTEAARAAAETAAAAAAAADNVEAYAWRIGSGKYSKQIITFSHAERDTVAYGEEFILKYAACRQIDLNANSDCSNKDIEDL